MKLFQPSFGGNIQPRVGILKHPSQERTLRVINILSRNKTKKFESFKLASKNIVKNIRYRILNCDATVTALLVQIVMLLIRSLPS